MQDHLYLAHHGIKGQKWGVRRFRNKDGTLTKQGKERYDVGRTEAKDETLKEKASNFYKNHDKQIKMGAAITGATLAVLGGIYLYKHMEPNYGYTKIVGAPLGDCLDMFDDSHSVSLPKGQVLQRISSEAVEDYTRRGQAYVSYKFRDNLRYMDRMQDVLHDSRPYVHRLVTTTGVNAPTRRDAARVYLSLHPNATQAEFINFMSYGIREKTESSEAFLDAIRRLGYNALIDENDAGSHWTVSPLILLDAGQVVDTRNVHRLNAFERVLGVYGR